MSATSITQARGPEGIPVSTKRLRQTSCMAEHALVIYGRLVTFDEEQPVIEDGALYIGGDGRIAAVQTRTEPAPGRLRGRREAAHQGLRLSRPDLREQMRPGPC